MLALHSLLPQMYPNALMSAYAWWDRAVPARVAAKARPVSIRSGTLIVHTASSAWAQELSFVAEDLIRAINKEAPKVGVRRLIARVGPVPKSHVPRPKPPPPKVQPITAGEIPAHIARSLAHVADDDLRDALSLAIRTSLAPVPSKKRNPS